MKDIMDPPHGGQLESENDRGEYFSNNKGAISFGIEFGRLIGQTEMSRL